MTATLTNAPLAFHLNGIESRPIGPVGGRGRPLPAQLVLPPGRYTVHGKTYRLHSEGLYRFLNPGVGNQQRIIYRKDPLALLSGIAWIASHGSRDHARPRTDWETLALREKVIITCGSVATLTVDILTRQGIPARVVHGKTLEALNTYDNGHVLIEAWLDGRWTLVDPDVKMLFRRGRRRLSLVEFSEASQTGDYTFERLSAATGIAVGCFEENGYDYGLFMETTFCNEACLRRWYKRIMMVPVIRAGGKWCITGTPSRMRKAARLYERDFAFYSRAEYLREFYQPPTPGVAGG